jgi:hypothetical protein
MMRDLTKEPLTAAEKEELRKLLRRIARVDLPLTPAEKEELQKLYLRITQQDLEI